MKRQKKQLHEWKLHYNGDLFAVTVPGDIVNDLMQIGVLPDVMFGDNYKAAEWVHDRDWEYETEFVLTEEEASLKHLVLTFDCIDTFARIELNGTSLGDTESMFRRYSFDLAGIARAGKNVLRVTVFSIRKRANDYKNDKYTACFNDERIFIRKSQCHFGWDWAPNFPGTGIAGDVTLELGDRGGIKDVRVNTFQSGAVGFTVETDYNNRDARKEQPIKGDILTVRVESAPGRGFSDCKKVSCEVYGAKNLLNIYLTAPALWYPNGYGEQPLYAYEVTLTRGGEVIDEKRGRFGIRTVEVREEPLGSGERRFDIYVNGNRFRAIGSNWVPCTIMTGTADAARYKKLLTYAKQAGINMLRVWGGGLYEKDAFYDFCDEYGILVWQDFMFSCGAVPDDILAFRDLIEQEATEQIVRLRNHPSIAVWSGGNELTDSFRADYTGYGKYVIETMLPGLTTMLDGTRKYLWDSPYSLTDVGNDLTSGDCHCNCLSGATAKNDIARYRRYQWGNENNFDSECAVIGMCRLRSFRKFMPEDKLWPQNELWEDRLSCNPYDDSVVSFTTRINMTVDALFGPVDDLADYIKKSMVAHAEVLTDEIDYFRSFERNSGLMNWMYNDIWGNGTWALVDFYGEKKPAYYAMKRAGRRRSASVVYRREGYFLSVINDTELPWEGELAFSHCLLSGQTLSSRKLPFALKAFSQTLLPVSFDESVKNAYLRLDAEGDIITYFYDLWKDKVFETDLDVHIRLDGTHAQVHIKANQYARFVFIDLPDGVEAELSDNYFDLPANETAVISIEASRPIKEGEITVKTYADRWEE